MLCATTQYVYECMRNREIDIGLVRSWAWKIKVKQQEWTRKLYNIWKKVAVCSLCMRGIAHAHTAECYIWSLKKWKNLKSKWAVPDDDDDFRLYLDGWFKTR